jgi:hypothetical protein
MNEEKKAWELYDVYPKPLKRLLREMAEHSFRGCFISLSLCLSLVHHHFKFRNHSSLSSPPALSQSATTNKQPYSSTATLTNRLLDFKSLAQLKRGSVTHTHTHTHTERVMSIEEFSRMVVVVVVDQEDDIVVLVYSMILVVALLLTLLLVEYVCFAFVEVQALYAFHASVVSYVTPLLQQPPRTFSLLSVCLRRALRRSSSPSSSSSSSSLAAAYPSPPSSSSP